MKPFTYHTHSTFCDGNNTLAEIADAAYKSGLDSLGLSCHSYVPFDVGCCILPEKEEDFKAEVRRLDEQYAPLGLDIFLGIEQDTCSEKLGRPEGYDYVIGSIHNLRLGDEYVTVDSKKSFYDNLCNYFAGDAVAMSLEYYRVLGSLYELTGCDIVGHIDIVTKFNEGGCLFDERDARYERAAGDAIEKLARLGLIFEINTGAVSRGYRSEPYPSKRLLSMIREAGGRVTYSGDSHDTVFLTYGFDSAKRLAAECGFDSFMKLRRVRGVCEFYTEEI